jgi:hypothetical protein
MCSNELLVFPFCDFDLSARSRDSRLRDEVRRCAASAVCAGVDCHDI